MNAAFMDAALKEAQKAAKENEVPVGAVIVYKDKIIAAAHNKCKKESNSTAHAEISAIKKAEKLLKKEKLTDCSIYVTLEPCLMCAGAIMGARIGEVVYGAADNEMGAVESAVNVFNNECFNYKPKIFGGIREAECKALIQDFFKKLR